MIRLLGAITGSALALATLLVLIGIPQFKTQATDTERAIVTLPLPTTAVDAPQIAATMANDDVVHAEAPATDAIDVAVRAAGEQPGASRDSGSTSDIKSDAPLPADVSDAPATDTPQVLDTAQSWYAFWSPFRSELAANGFVSQLQSVTGLDYRVVRIKPGVYEVAFAYDDDDDIPASLTQITAATGLELPQ